MAVLNYENNLMGKTLVVGTGFHNAQSLLSLLETCMAGSVPSFSSIGTTKMTTWKSMVLYQFEFLEIWLTFSIWNQVNIVCALWSMKLTALGLSRLYIMECVPVIIADNFVLPFNEVLDWDAFSVTGWKGYPKLKEILLAIPLRRYLKMQINVKMVQTHFLWNQDQWDVIHSLWYNRLNQIQISQS